MANILCIAEKPEVARDIAGAILSNSKKIPIGFQGEYEGDTWAVTSAFGHLLDLSDPEAYGEQYKEWKLEDLPLYFPNWSLVPSPEDYKYKRLSSIGTYLKACDEVVCAGDPDDEGQLLIDEIIDYYGFKGPCRRVFINDNLQANIRKEFRNMKNNDDYRPLSKAAFARRMADKCFGINETRLAGLKLHRKGLSIGRVQTPTLGLVVARDKQIEGHEKEKYYELDAIVKSPVSGKLLPFHFKADKRYLEENGSDVVKDRAFLQQIADFIRGKDIPFTTTEKEKVTNPPLPFNLTVLQSEMNKRYGYSMSRTLDITQSLRGKKAITYNRSDSQYLKEEHFAAAPDLFRTILNGSLIETYQPDFERHSKCFNDSLVTAHHAIIPQAVNIDLESLTKDEKNVYMAIVERYVMQFLPPMKQMVSESKVALDLAGYTHTFTYKAETVTDPGYTRFFRPDKEEDRKQKEYLPAGKYLSNVNSCTITEKETKPPARYTEGTLAKDMASIAKYVTDPEIRDILKRKDDGKKGENGSIGTVATRGAIVETLFKRGFLEKKGKNIISTTLGRQFYDILPKEITGADITAKWWLIQEAIKEGSETDENAIQRSVVEEFNRHRETAYNGAKLEPQKQKEKVSGIFHGEKISFNREWGDHTFTEEEIIALLAGEEITFTETSSNGNPYEVTGKLEKQKYKGYTYYGFKKKEPPAKEGYVSGTWKKKKITFKGEWGGHVFTAEEIESLLAGEEITFLFRTKSGEEKEVTGKLANQTFNSRKFVGFKANFKKK